MTQTRPKDITRRWRRRRRRARGIRFRSEDVASEVHRGLVAAAEHISIILGLASGSGARAELKASAKGRLGGQWCAAAALTRCIAKDGATSCRRSATTESSTAKGRVSASEDVAAGRDGQSWRCGGSVAVDCAEERFVRDVVVLVVVVIGERKAASERRLGVLFRHAGKMLRWAMVLRLSRNRRELSSFGRRASPFGWAGRAASQDARRKHRHLGIFEENIPERYFDRTPILQ